MLGRNTLNHMKADLFDFQVSLVNGTDTARLTPLNNESAQTLWEELFVGKHSVRDGDSVELPYHDIKTLLREFYPNAKVNWSTNIDEELSSKMMTLSFTRSVN